MGTLDTQLQKNGAQISPKAAGARPIDIPRHAQVSTNQDVRVIARLFILDTKRIGIFGGDDTAVKELPAFVQVEAYDDYCSREPWVEAAVPEGICQAHRMRQAKCGAVQVEGASFSVISSEDFSVLTLFFRQ